MNDFTPVLIKDARIADITDNLDYAVMSGASSNTYQQFKAITNSTSSMTFNVQVPSENIVVNREVLITSIVNVQIRVTNIPTGQHCWPIASMESLAPFPLNQLFTTSSCQINNTSVSVNTQDVLSALLTIGDMETSARYNAMTASLPDAYYKMYNNAAGFNGTVANPGANPGTFQTNNNPMAGYDNASYENDLIPRGSVIPSYLDIKQVVVTPGTPPTYAVNPGVSISTDPTNIFFIRFTMRLTEPIIGLSPFIYGNPQFNKQGLVGVNSMNFVFNIDSTARRFYCRAANTGDQSTPNVFKLSLGWAPAYAPDNTTNVYADSKDAFEKTNMLVNFLSTQPSDLISAKNIVPYMDLPRYISSNSDTVTNTSSATLNSNNIQLNQLPDYFIIFVRDQNLQNDVPGDFNFYLRSQTFLTINSITVNLSNTSGLLSSATQEDLWRMSVNNGSNQHWLGFSGQAAVGQEDTGNGTSNVIATAGSVLILSPAMDLSLPDYITSGSIGQFNFQFNIGVTNRENRTAKPEIVVIAANSGIFSTVAGSSSVYTGILSKQIVLDAKSSQRIDPLTSTQYMRSVGGSLADRALGALKANPLAKKYADKIRDRMCGGGPSGGVMSGGRLSNLTIR